MKRRRLRVSISRVIRAMRVRAGRMVASRLADKFTLSRRSRIRNLWGVALQIISRRVT